MIDEYDVTSALEGSDELYGDGLGDGRMKPGTQAVYIERYTLNKNAKTGWPQLILNLIGADDAVGNRGQEASCWFAVVTKAWADEDPSVLLKARFLKAFFTGLGVADFKVTQIKEYLDGMVKMPFKVKISRMSGDFANLETLGFMDGAAADPPVGDAEAPF